jgi:hypothetical protein
MVPFVVFAAVPWCPQLTRLHALRDLRRQLRASRRKQRLWREAFDAALRGRLRLLSGDALCAALTTLSRLKLAPSPALQASRAPPLPLPPPLALAVALHAGAHERA